MQIRKLHETFGAEVLGFDLASGGSAAEVRALQEAFDEHQLLLFRGGPRLPPERQVEISSWFGEPVSNARGGEPWTTLRNDTARGSARLPFHSDNTYTYDPPTGLCLHPIEVPPGGAATAFVSGVHAWASLPADLQAQLAPLTARHWISADNVGFLPELAADNPVRLSHPRTGRPVLYVTEHHAVRINELSAEDSERMLARLFAHLYAPERVYTHRWRLHELIVWDNLAVQHSRPEPAEPEAGVRTMQRVMLGGMPFFEIVERARQAAAATGSA